MKLTTLILFLFIGIICGTVQAGGHINLLDARGSSRNNLGQNVYLGQENPWPIFFKGDSMYFTVASSTGNCSYAQSGSVVLEKGTLDNTKKDSESYGDTPYDRDHFVTGWQYVATLKEFDAGNRFILYHTIPIPKTLAEIHSDIGASGWYRFHAALSEHSCDGTHQFFYFYVMDKMDVLVKTPILDHTEVQYGEFIPFYLYRTEGHINTCSIGFKRNNGDVVWVEASVKKNICASNFQFAWNVLQDGEEVTVDAHIESAEGQSKTISLGNIKVKRNSTNPITITQTAPWLTNLHSDYLIDGSVRITGQLMAIDSGKKPEGTKFRIAFAPGDEYSKSRDVKWDGMNFTITVPKDNLPSYTLSPDIMATAENGLSSQWRAAPFPFANLVELYLLNPNDYPANDNVSGKTGEMQIGVKLVIKHPIDQFYLDLQLPDEVTPGATKPNGQCVNFNSMWNGQTDNGLATLTNLTPQDCIIHIPINVLKLPSNRIQATLRLLNGTPDQELNADIHLVQ